MSSLGSWLKSCHLPTWQVLGPMSHMSFLFQNSFMPLHSSTSIFVKDMVFVLDSFIIWCIHYTPTKHGFLGRSTTMTIITSSLIIESQFFGQVAELLSSMETSMETSPQVFVHRSLAWDFTSYLLLWNEERIRSVFESPRKWHYWLSAWWHQCLCPMVHSLTFLLY